MSIFQQYLLHLSCTFGGVEGPPLGLQSLNSQTSLTDQGLVPQQIQQAAAPQKKLQGSGLSMTALLSRHRTPKPDSLPGVKQQLQQGVKKAGQVAPPSPFAIPTGSDQVPKWVGALCVCVYVQAFLPQGLIL